MKRIELSLSNSHAYCVAYVTARLAPNYARMTEPVERLREELERLKQKRLPVLTNDTYFLGEVREAERR